MAVCILNRFGFRSVFFLERVVELLRVGDIGVCELLQNRTDLGEVLQLDLDARVYAIADKLTFWVFVVVNRLDRVIPDLCQLWIQAVRAKDLSDLLSLF